VFTLEQVVAEVGTDPVALTAWVASNVGLAPYEGAMRGAVGTLTAGEGSSADQALLVQELVLAANPSAEVRFAACELGGAELERSEGLLAAVAAPRPRTLLEGLASLAPQMESAEVRTTAQALAGAWSGLTQLTARHAGVLADALAELDQTTDLPTPLVAVTGASQSAHVWLQAEANGSWLDLDPTAATVPGTRCTVAATSAGLPPELLHTLVVRVVVETRDSGVPTETTLLGTTAALLDLQGGSATFAVAEAFGDDLTGAREPDGAGLLRYTPVLLLGDHTLQGEPFYLPSLAPAPDAAGGGGFFDLGKALDDALGGTDGEEAATEADPTGGATALWLDFTLASPGGSSTVRSVVFDRIGFAARAAGQTATAVPAALPELEGEYLDLATVWNIGAWTGKWWYLEAPVETGEGVAAVAADLAAWHASFELTRQALAEAVLGENAALRPAGPTLSLLGWRPSAADGSSADLVMDVLVDPGATLPAGHDPAQERLAAATWAVAGVVAERLLVDPEHLLLAAFGEPVPEGPGTLDLLALLDAAAEQGVSAQWLAVGEGPTSASAAALARVAAHQEGGAALYLPTRAVDWGEEALLGWWMLSPSTVTGAQGPARAKVRDELETGRHQAMPEYNVTQQPSRAAAPTLRQSLGRRIVCSIGRAVFVLDLISALSGQPGGGQAAWGLAKGAAKVAEAAEKTRRAGKSLGGSCSIGAGPPVP